MKRGRMRVDRKGSAREVLERACLVAFVLTCGTRSDAQDPQFSQLTASAVYMSPAFQGNTGGDRFGLIYRKQWPGTGPGYDTYLAQFDRFVRRVNSGFGGYVLRDRAGTTGLAFTQVAFGYAYAARLDRASVLRLGIRGAFSVRDYDRSRMVFADQIERDHTPVSVETALIERTSYPDLAFGALFHDSRFWAGISFAHLNRPQQSLLQDGDARIPVRTSVHMGHRSPLDGNSRYASIHLNVGCQYRMQGEWDQLDVGATVDLEDFSVGTWYRGLPGLKAYAPGYPNDDAVILLFAYRSPSRFKVGYSYDLTVSRLGIGSGGSHELSLFYESPVRNKRRKFRIISCPVF